MRIFLTEFVTLDGVSQGPGSPTEDTSDDFTRGGWLVPYLDEAFVQRTSGWLELADGLLLGRRTYEAFARDWPQITDPNDPFTERMNSLPKYVVTNTITQGSWHPTTVLHGDPIETVGRLKAQPGRELQIHGSTRLGRALLSAGLVDTLRLAVAPTVTGSGRRLLDHPSTPLAGCSRASSRSRRDSGSSSTTRPTDGRDWRSASGSPNTHLAYPSEQGWLQAFTKLDATLMNVQAVAADHREVEAWQS